MKECGGDEADLGDCSESHFTEMKYGSIGQSYEHIWTDDGN
jgi:hypothetical protein